MDAAAAAAIDEAARKSALVWVAPPTADARAQPMWHLWQDESVFVLTGGIEQPAPFAAGDVVRVTVRSKDTRARVATFDAEASVVDPESELWATVTPDLLAKRLNLPDHETAVARWARECTVFRLTPTGTVDETPDDPSTQSHAAEPPPTPARSKVPRPWHLRGRPARNRGGR